MLSGVLGVIWNLFALVLTSMEATLGWSRLESSVGFSIFALAHALSAPLIGVLLARLNSRVIMAGLTICLAVGLGSTAAVTGLPMFYLCFGILAGVGTQALGSYFVFTVISNRIHTRPVTAMAIADAGAGVGLFLGLPLTNLLLRQMGWQVTFLSLAAVALVVGLVSHLLLLPALRLPRFAPTVRARPRIDMAGLTMGGSMLFGAAALQGLQSQQLAMFAAFGAPDAVVILAVSAGGLAMFAWRLGAGQLADRYGARLPMLIAASGAALAFTVIGAFWCGAPVELLVLYPLAFAAGYGAQGIIFAALARAAYDTRAFIRSLAIIRLCAGTGLFLGPLLAGASYESGGYAGMLWAIGAITIVHVALFWAVGRKRPASTPTIHPVQ